VLGRQKAFDLAPCLPKFGHRGLDDSSHPLRDPNLQQLCKIPGVQPWHACLVCTRASSRSACVCSHPAADPCCSARWVAGPIGVLCVRTTPEADATNGFFVARFVRKQGRQPTTKAVRRHPHSVALGPRVRYGYCRPFGNFRSRFMLRTLWMKSRARVKR
jgi:hypothetical protein